jgi:heme-degrading monooxygenase HmoA
MYGTVRVYENHDLADRLVEHADEVKGLLSAIDGFKGYYLIKTATGTASVSVYETEAGAAESNSAAAGWIKENLPDYAGSPPQVSAGEVVIDF